MGEEPNWEQWSDRQWSIHASNRAAEAYSIAGDIASRWNTMAQDNRTLLGQVDRLQRELADLKETVGLLTGIILGDT